MARRTGKTNSRLELRRAAEAAERMTGNEKTPKTKAAAAKKKVAKKPERAKPAKKKKKKKEAQRLRMVWEVRDNSNQTVAKFGYAEKAAAEQKAKELNDKGRGPFFVQPAKEAMAPAEEIEIEEVEEVEEVEVVVEPEEVEVVDEIEEETDADLDIEADVEEDEEDEEEEEDDFEEDE